MFELVVGTSLAVMALIKLWDWIGDRLYEFSLAFEVTKREDDE